MTDEEAERLTRAPYSITVNKDVEFKTLTGRLKRNDDGTYQVDTGLGHLENPAYIIRFTAPQIVKAKPL